MSLNTTREGGVGQGRVGQARRGRKPAAVKLPQLSQLVPPVALGIALLGIWEVTVRLEIVNPIIVPGPIDVGSALLDLLPERFFWDAVRVTLTETVYGFALAGVVGLVLGALVGMFPAFRRAVYPFVITFQNMPRIALAPVFLTWFGFGLTSKVVMAATIAFFPIVINTVVGLASVDRDARLLMQSLGVSRFEMFRYLTLPTAAPYIFAGFKTALTLALLGAIVGEFVGASEGLGVLIKQFNFELNVSAGFAVVIFLAVIGLILYGFVEFLDRKIIFWRGEA